MLSRLPQEQILIIFDKAQRMSTEKAISFGCALSELIFANTSLAQS